VRNAPQVEDPTPTENPDYQPPGRPAAAQGGKPETEDGDGDDGRPGRREARYRRERNEARARVAELEQRVEGLLYRDVARIAGDTLENGWDLVLSMPGVADVLEDNGIPDPEKIAERAEQLAEWKPGLRKGARVPTPSFGQGRRTSVDSGTGASWGEVLRGR
jgi:hypothetical protein